MRTLSFNHQMSDIYLTKRDCDLWRDNESSSSLVSSYGQLTFAVLSGGFVEYVDEISLLRCVRVLFVLRSVMGTRWSSGAMHKICLIFIRRSALCHEGFKHTAALIQSSSLHNEWTQRFKNKTKKKKLSAISFTLAAPLPRCSYSIGKNTYLHHTVYKFMYGVNWVIQGRLVCFF